MVLNFSRLLQHLSELEAYKRRLVVSHFFFLTLSDQKLWSVNVSWNKESVAFLPERSLRPACGLLIHSELIHLLCLLLFTQQWRHTAMEMITTKTTVSTDSPLIQSWHSERRDICLYPAAAWAGARPSPAEGRPPWPRTHTDALVVRGELIYGSPLSHITFELRVLLTCCAAESDGQLSRDRQHPHILQGRKNDPVTQGHFHWWQRKGWMKSISDMFIIICSDCLFTIAGEADLIFASFFTLFFS